MATTHQCMDCGRSQTDTVLPHGRLCLGCRRRRHYHPRPCPGCCQTRPLAYRTHGHDDDVCADCAGQRSIFQCVECGSEEHPYGYVRCARCFLRERLTEVMTDPATGTIHHQLVPVFDTLIASGRPQTTLWWLVKPRSIAGPLFQQFATGTLPISHDTFRVLPMDRRHCYLRDLLASTGVLPPYSAAIERIHPWLDTILAQQPPGHGEVLARYARWHVLRRMRRHANAGTLTSSIVNQGRAHITGAARLMDWTHAHDTTIGTLTQAQLEHYLAQNTGARTTLSNFLTWLVSSRTNTAISLVHPKTQPPHVTMTDQARWGGVELLLHEQTISLASRVAGLFMLLFAQPLNKIVRMTRDQVTTQADGHVIITFDTVPIELPPGVGTLVLQHIDDRSTASYRVGDTDWLFPGRLPGRSMHTESIRRTLAPLGIHPRQSRSAALFALAGQIPTPVLADLLGISRNTATQWATLAARDWSGYTAKRAIELKTHKARTQ